VVFELEGLADAAAHGDAAGADHLADAERAQQVDQRLDLFLLADHLDDDRVGGDVDDAGAKDVGDLHDLAATAGTGGDLDERQFAFDRDIVLDLGDLDHRDQLVELFLDLVDFDAGGVDDDRHARDAGRLGMADGEAVDV